MPCLTIRTSIHILLITNQILCMRKLFLAIFLVIALVSSAQNKSKFSPERFQAELEKYITQEAQLTADEATRFFPVYREMLQKQRAQGRQMKHQWKERLTDDAACRKAIELRDAAELEQKRLQQQYHQQFLKLLSPQKVYDVIRAEDRFMRHTFRNWGKGQKDDKSQRSQ